ncbi:two-component regulator propeller domain-containing protein [Paraflavitalea speifideaquila]|uniref:two-component regulator propeller domain-containing protein n=1 Tax=Paraflavitalea speifideaquila TaxID=3076558 RepID=UPI003312F8A4
MDRDRSWWYQCAEQKNGTCHYLLSNEDDPRSLSQNSIITTYKDKAGIIWLGTFKRASIFTGNMQQGFPCFPTCLRIPTVYLIMM